MVVYKAKLQEIMDKHAKKVKELRKSKEEYRANYAGNALKQLEEGLEEEERKSKAASVEAIAAAAESAVERVEALEASGRELNTSDMMLLDPARVKMKQAEFDVLAKRYENSYSMRIALRSYAESMGLKYDSYTNKEELTKKIKDMESAAVRELYAHNGFGYSAEASERMATRVVF